MATVVEDAQSQMEKTIESTKENFVGIRTGRANPALFNGLTVDYYGAPTPLKALASVGVSDNRTLQSHHSMYRSARLSKKLSATLTSE